MKNIQTIGFTIGLALLTSCASSPPQTSQSAYTAPTSEVAPLPAVTTPPQVITFQVVSALATRSPQLNEQKKYTLKNPHYNPGSTVEQYDMDIQSSYTPIDLATSDSFVIVSIRLLNVSSKLKLSPNDIPLVDGKGTTHLALGCPSFTKQDAWSALAPSDSLGLEPKDIIDLKWIFEVSTDALTPSTIQFQGKTYPLTMTSN
jgi:hypothetical protein